MTTTLCASCNEPLKVGHLCNQPDERTDVEQDRRPPGEMDDLAFEREKLRRELIKITDKMAEAAACEPGSREQEQADVHAAVDLFLYMLSGRPRYVDLLAESAKGRVEAATKAGGNGSS